MFDAMSRRTFTKTLTMSAMASLAAKTGWGEGRVAYSGAPTEWAYASGKQYSDPFNRVDVDAIITTPSGKVCALCASGAWYLQDSICVQ
jgi:hypothetical protein